MKRFLALVVAASMGVAIVGCDSGKTDTKKTESSTSTNVNGQKATDTTKTETKMSQDKNGGTSTKETTTKETTTPGAKDNSGTTGPVTPSTNK